MARDASDRDGVALTTALPPPLAAALESTCTALAVAMRDARDPWCVIGSAAIALHGIDPGPIGDVDVLASAQDAQRFVDAVGIELAPGRPDARFRSAAFGRWTAAALPVEIMAGFAVRSDAGWRVVSPQATVAIDTAGGRVYLPSLAELTILLDTFGRRKDRVRVAAIRAAVAR